MLPIALVSRRQCLRIAALGGGTAVLGLTGHAQNPSPLIAIDAGAELVTPETQVAIDRGLELMTNRRSQMEDGSFSGYGGAAVGITALAGLALMAGGNQPGRGRYGQNVSRTLDYILSVASANPPGYLGAGDAQHPAGRAMGTSSGMYSHGFGTLFLAEVCGMLPDPQRQRKVRSALEQAVACIVAAQNKEGGWRYDPRPTDADVSVTVAQMMALRAARNAGVAVRAEVMNAAARYVQECQVPSDGGFSYHKGQRFSAFARSAASLVGLYSHGTYTGPEIERGLRYLQRYIPGRQYPPKDIPPQHYFYGQYYAALAMWTAGGEYWTQWYPAIREELLDKLRKSMGTWQDNSHGSVYATAMSLIILQLPNNYLPILQK